MSKLISLVIILFVLFSCKREPELNHIKFLQQEGCSAKDYIITNTSEKNN